MSTLENTTLENTTLENTTLENTDPVTNTRRPRLCGHCRGEGHDRRTCPAPEQVERRIERRRLTEIARSEQRALRATAFLNRNSMISYKIFNENIYDINLYWCYQSPPSMTPNPPKFLMRIPHHSSKKIKAGVNTCRLICIPSIEIPHQDSVSEPLDDYTVIYNEVTTSEDVEIHIIYEYIPKKPLIDQWMECGLKSIFLLKELGRMGATKYGNLEPIMDMIQDIKIPTHTEHDKENAGVPSALTNIT
jgi:hypothetical protein